MPKKTYWRIRATFEGLFIGDRFWGRVRFWSAVVMGIIYMVLTSLLFEARTTQAMVASWRDGLPLLDLVPTIFLRIIASFFSWGSLRFLLIPLGGILTALFVCARYIKDIYELNDIKQAWQYIVAALFGINYPRLLIAEGMRKVGSNEMNLLDRIGGPGFVLIQPGNIALFERLEGPSSVRAGGAHFISRPEKVKEIVSLEDQSGFIESISATSKDGIEVTVKDVQYRYRLRTGRRTGDYTRRTPQNPYPFSTQAMRNMTYNRLVRKEGITSWHDSVKGAITGAIADYVHQHQLDYLTRPTDNERNPRVEMTNKLNSPAMREILKRIGAELLWFDIGHFEIEEPAKDQKVSTWQARWVGSAKVIRAYGEAQLTRLIERGRAEGQAEILVTIINALNHIGITSVKARKDAIRNLVLVRTAQILDRMAERHISQLQKPKV